jgi:hypothetical protein
MKICQRCNTRKDTDSFAPRSGGGRRNLCRQCTAEYHAEYYKKNRIRQRENGRLWNIKNREKKSLHGKKYYAENREKILAQCKIYAKLNRRKISAYVKNRRRTDPLFKMAKNCRSRIGNFIRARGLMKPCGTERLLGADFNQVKAWIESQFSEGMSWSNYGEWHLDHKIPLLTARTMDELLPLFSYENLQPLWAIDNFSKSKSKSSYV